MKSGIKSFIFSIIMLSFLAVSGTVNASVFLPVGPALASALPGTTAAAEPDLVGGVIYDKLIPFSIVGAGGAVLFIGTLQNRVVKSAGSGNLHFYYRIRDTKPGLNGIISNVFTRSFPTPPNIIFADWRVDGLGMIDPLTAQRSGVGGSLVKFDFLSPGHFLVGGRDSKFFFVKTTSKNFVHTGETRIQLRSGESVSLRTVMGN
ncbi:MAG: hypothetical protein HQK52_06560 [Oligoflexia bacterium]|nr:hypothetical protein [Oligoflexia bacterium]